MLTLQQFEEESSKSNISSDGLNEKNDINQKLHLIHFYVETKCVYFHC